MSPQVIAAVIAASVSFLTLIGTLAAQYFGRRATSRDTERTLKEQGEQLDRTLGEQRKQLDRTLAEQRTRTLNERFATAAGQLGDDKPAAVRLAGVYAVAGLADDWADNQQNQQTCVDVLCGYLRMPYEPDPGDDAPGPERLSFRASRQVRHTAIRVITAHLQADAAVSWQGLNFDFTGVVFDGGDFSSARFSGGKVSFNSAEFSGGKVSFTGARFSGGTVDFTHAEFSGGTVDFGAAEFSGGEVSFYGAGFSGGTVDFMFAWFSGGTVDFMFATFSGGKVSFNARFSGGEVYFGGALFFSGGEVDFGGARFSGSEVRFTDDSFIGGMVDFSGTADWSHPPAFPWTGTPPPGVKLPGRIEPSGDGPPRP